MHLNRWLTGGVSLLLLSAYIAGCAAEGSDLKDPNQRALSEAMEGHYIEADGGRRIRMTRAGVLGLVVRSVSVGPEGQTGSSEVSFMYQQGSRRFRVTGVASYVRTLSGSPEAFYFETTKVSSD